MSLLKLKHLKEGKVYFLVIEGIPTVAIYEIYRIFDAGWKYEYKVLQATWVHTGELTRFILNDVDDDQIIILKQLDNKTLFDHKNKVLTFAEMLENEYPEYFI